MKIRFMGLANNLQLSDKYKRYTKSQNYELFGPDFVNKNEVMTGLV